MLNRMEGLVKIADMKSLETIVNSIIADIEDEDFELGDIAKFLNNKIAEIIADIK